MASSNNQNQVDIFAPDQQHRQFAELCNALYERELSSLAKKSTISSGLLQRRLAGLSHHIKNAAENLLNHTAPIDVDIHNASWRGKQTAKSVISKHNPEKTNEWFNSYARMGLPVPVHICDATQQYVELDSIDRIDAAAQRLHLNKHGWFSFAGQALLSKSETNQNPNISATLLLPNRANIIAACCGHSWNHNGRADPRALELRELLLSTTINWKHFR